MLPGVRVAYETWGTLDGDGGNAVQEGIAARLAGDLGQITVKLLRIAVPGLTWLLAIAWREGLSKRRSLVTRLRRLVSTPEDAEFDPPDARR